jgi:hypothetical protein
VLNRLLPDPTVTFNSHSFASLPRLIPVLTVAKAGQNRSPYNPFPVASLDSSSYGSVLALTISVRVSNITVLNPGPKYPVSNKLQPKDGAPND